MSAIEQLLLLRTLRRLQKQVPTAEIKSQSQLNVYPPFCRNLITTNVSIPWSKGPTQTFSPSMYTHAVPHQSINPFIAALFASLTGVPARRRTGHRRALSRSSGALWRFSPSARTPIRRKCHQALIRVGARANSMFGWKEGTTGGRTTPWCHPFARLSETKLRPFAQ